MSQDTCSECNTLCFRDAGGDLCDYDTMLLHACAMPDAERCPSERTIPLGTTVLRCRYRIGHRGFHRAQNGIRWEKRAEEAFQEDIAAILRALGLSDHARPVSARVVVHEEILPAIAALRGGPTLEYARVLRDVWEEYWRDKAGHRYANDFFAFLGERVATDYDLRSAFAGLPPALSGEERPATNDA